MGFKNMMRAATVAAALFASSNYAAPTTAPSPAKRDNLKFAFRTEKIRGVNLGGWFVLEPFITPSIFDAAPSNVVDEYTLCQALGKDEAAKRLQQHWSTWITADDFADIASKGLNFVRIPIGYWAINPLPGDPYVQGAYEYLGQALDWAQGAGLKVMIDLHGAPGSQNGFDNSGRRGAVSWTQGDTIAQTLTALAKIRDDHAAHPAVAAIELLNEPLGPNLNMDVVRQFMSAGYETVHNTTSSNVAVAFHDAFQGPTAWNSWGGDMGSLLLDTHHYEVFDAGVLQLNAAGHVSSACAFGAQMAGSNKWTVAGEFTAAMTDCARYLNGRGVGARFDGSFNFNGQGSSYIGSCAGTRTSGTAAAIPEPDRTDLRNFVGAQMVAFEKADGWIFWTWKTESAPEWSFKDLADAGIVPQPLSSVDTAICG